MTLDSIWSKEGDCLNKDSVGFRARSAGCSCCSSDLDTEDDVRKEVLNSLKWVLLASKYFRWSVEDLIREADIKASEQFLGLSKQ